ncbi:hypothetical protein ACJJTC_006496 [Scirpophaga incertulas]
MSQSDIDTIYKSLRLLPEFDGNPHVLTRFIHLCDQLVLAHFNTEPGNELSNLALINGILNKVTGPAARYINANGIAENWSGIRSRIRCMRPETMEKALEYVQDELNTLYLQSRNENGPSHKKEWPPQSLSNQNFNLPLNNFVPKLSNAPTFPRQPLFNIPSTSQHRYSITVKAGDPIICRIITHPAVSPALNKCLELLHQTITLIVQKLDKPK